MWTLLIFILLCAIGLLLWLHYRQEQAWRQEMAAWEAEGGKIAPSKEGLLTELLAALTKQRNSRSRAMERLLAITGKKRLAEGHQHNNHEENNEAPVSVLLQPEQQESEVYSASPDFPHHRTRAAPIGRNGRVRLSDVPDPEIVPFEESLPFEYQSRRVENNKWVEITLEEAERSLTEAMLQEAAEQKTAQVAAQPSFAPVFEDKTPQLRSSAHVLEGLPVIDLNDPVLKRTRERVQAEADEIRIRPAAAPKIEYTQTALRMLENEKHGAWQQTRAFKDEIGVADIEDNLLRRRSSGRRHAVLGEPRSTEPQIIPDEEVYANLAQTGSPLTRRVQPLRRVDTRMRESVLPDAARVDNLAAKVQPHKPFVSSKPKLAPIPVHPPVSVKEAPPAPFINRPAAPDATVVEPPPVPPTPPVAIDIPEPPLFNPPPAAVLPEVSAHVSDKPLRSIHDYLISESAEHEETPVVSVTEAAQEVSAPVQDDEQESADWGYEDAEYMEADQIQTASDDTWPSETESDAEADSVSESERDAELDDANYDEAVSDAVGINLPSVDLLLPPQFDPTATQTEEALLENSITIEDKLAEFKVKVKVVDSYSGPVITRYEIEPDVGVRGNAVLNLEKDLARSLGVASIRVVETIPGKTCMGLELPNPRRQTIRLSEIFNSPAFTESKSKLTLALGQDITGEPVVTDLAKAPHLLVAGTTGSGKSVGVNAMILSMLFKAKPEEVRMIMIDPKMLELSIYEGIPHLLAPVVTDMKLAANALNWCVNEMEKRYRLMSHMGVRNLDGFNQKIAQASAKGQKIVNPFSLTPDHPEPLEKLPFIVVVVDEFADLMMTAGKKIEELIARLAQKARAAGIHLILATQRPSVDVITGLIKANIPTRIAFQVSSKIDSRTILDQMGAENLLGQGDMLFLPPGTGYPQRVHGAFASDDEVHQVVEYLKQFGEPDYIDEICAGGVSDEIPGMSGNRSEGETDPLYDEAVAHVVKTRKASISGVQRVLRIGYNRAARLIDQMEEDGIVSAAETNGNRTVLAPPGSHL